MRNTIAIILVLFWFIFAGYWYLCHIKSYCCTSNDQETPILVDTVQTFTTEDSLVETLTFDETNIEEEVFSEVDYTTQTADFSKSIIFYAPSGSTSFIPDESQNALIKQLKAFTEENPDKKIEIIGHTDDEGSEEGNHKLGLKRAQKLRWYIYKHGKIDRKIMFAKSEGETNPIRPNDTDENKALNRRIEIKVID